MSAVIDKIKSEPVITFNTAVTFLVGLNEYLAGNLDPADGWKGLAVAVVTYVTRLLVTPNKKAKEAVADAKAEAAATQTYLS